MGHPLAGNILGISGLVLMIFPLTAWVYIFSKQFGYLKSHQNREQLAKPKTYRLHVLIARLSLFLPLYAIFIYICVMEPSYFQGLQPLFAIVEGYSFYAMFALIVANLGGPLAAIRVMQNHPEEVPCCSWCPDQPTLFYPRVLSALKYFLFLRVPFIIIGSVAYYHNLKIINVVMTLVTLGLLINGLVSLVTFYENVMHLGLSHFAKVITLKVSIGLIVVQGIIEMFMESGGVFDSLQANSGYTVAGTLTRYYCFLILLEYVLFSGAVAYFYSDDIKYTDFANPAQSSSSIDVTSSNSISVAEFLSEVLCVHDIWTKYSLEISGTELWSLSESAPGKGSIELQ